MLMASPHSGTLIPQAFLRSVQLPLSAIRRMEDAHVGRLLAPAAALGIPLLEATHSRAVIDLNRAADELDPKMFDGPVTATPAITERVRAGYGLVPRIAGPGLPIHCRRLPAAATRAHVLQLHQPWHAAIAQGLAAARARHGHALLLDMHSMPPLPGAAPAQLVLGDRHGQSAAPRLVDWLDDAFRARGLKVARNSPYAGGYTTQRHGQPATGQHAVQLEFDRSLYMDPVTLVPHDGFAALAAMIAEVTAALRATLPQLLDGEALPLAAE
ncbi:N-formylglutamate amidohydrolase [Sandaracinobacteroides sp. A072]|uniref:N-formylglutamate amidohydrolase n=1 Tax=Sandaracinobacteroides sp. A072 TaxID=3461146 RepID=UPI00404251E2